MPKPVSEFQPQLLDLSPIVEVKGSRRMSPRERFDAFHRQNPGVYTALRTLALDMRGRGVNRHSINGLFEVLRWKYAIQTQGDDYRLNNDFRAYYARLLMAREPELGDFFETRRCPSQAQAE